MNDIIVYELPNNNYLRLSNLNNIITQYTPSPTVSDETFKFDITLVVNGMYTNLGKHSIRALCTFDKNEYSIVARCDSFTDDTMIISYIWSVMTKLDDNKTLINLINEIQDILIMRRVIVSDDVVWAIIFKLKEFHDTLLHEKVDIIKDTFSYMISSFNGLN